MKRIIIFILLIPIFAYSFFATSWTGSYIMLEEDWKNHIVFTPENAKRVQEFKRWLLWQPIFAYCTNEACYFKKGKLETV